MIEAKSTVMESNQKENESSLASEDNEEDANSEFSFMSVKMELQKSEDLTA